MTPEEQTAGLLNCVALKFHGEHKYTCACHSTILEFAAAFAEKDEQNRNNVANFELQLDDLRTENEELTKQLGLKAQLDWFNESKKAYAKVAELRAENQRLKKAATVAGTLELLEEANRRIDEYAELGRQDALEAARIELGGEISSLRGQLADLRAENERLKVDSIATNEIILEGNTEINELEAQLAEANNAFENFHNNLCSRFGYIHDPIEWRRDLASLEEYIAAQLADLQQMNRTLWAALTPEKRHELNFAALQARV